jgi:hypothetical protein
MPCRVTALAVHRLAQSLVALAPQRAFLAGDGVLSCAMPSPVVSRRVAAYLFDRLG